MGTRFQAGSYGDILKKSAFKLFRMMVSLPVKVARIFRVTLGNRQIKLSPPCSPSVNATAFSTLHQDLPLSVEISTVTFFAFVPVQETLTALNSFANGSLVGVLLTRTTFCVVSTMRGAATKATLDEYIAATGL